MKLADIVKKKIRSLETSERNIENYSIAQWPYMMADNNGSIRTLKQIEMLLSFVKELK